MTRFGSRETSTRAEFGDFQTPADLARSVCLLLRRSGFEPASIVEPTCGKGAFVRAALDLFPTALRIEAADTNVAHLDDLRASVAGLEHQSSLQIREADFFRTDWRSAIAAMPEPILILGNPPWVTNSDLGVLQSDNLPDKRNLDALRGIDALTGRSNFDISEWMLRENVEWLRGRHGALAVLCKTAVARKVLQFAWREKVALSSAAIYRIDAKGSFNASVDACLLVIHVDGTLSETTALDYSAVDAPRPSARFGMRDGVLLGDVDAYERWAELRGRGIAGWRSGVKHDCSKVFELVRSGDSFVNGLGERIQLEAETVFPLLKSSDLANNRVPTRWLLTTQRHVSDDPSGLAASAPQAWGYLTWHAATLRRRSSSIYRGRPEFSIFGIGPYSFSPWKVAISGLYKRLEFSRIAPFDGKPVLLDDTCYFFPCESEDECDTLFRLLESRPAKEFLSSFIFWDAKRPITAGILNSISIAELARAVGEHSTAVRMLANRQLVERAAGQQQLLLGEPAEPFAAT